MDIHRCRFVNFEPSAINALAFTHSSGRAGRNQPIRLAIGRANGDIEIWDPLQGIWLHECTLQGGKDRSIEGLAWIQDPDEKDEETGFVTYGKLRLFSIGYASTVTEWNLITGLPLRNSSGSHSEVWCLAAQPKISRGEKTLSTAGLSQDLVVGCADGSLILLSTRDDALAFQKFIARASKKQARALSLTFQDRNTLVAGFADSTIRVYDIRNGNLLRTMSLGPGPRGGPKEKLVWALECLKDGTIVSGDSAGEVRFWDGQSYSQRQRIQAHEADTLCLASSEDGKTIVSGGIDRRTVRFSLSASEGQSQRWAKTAHSRHHKHDIKAMVSFENSKMSFVVSGGIDTIPMVIPLREHGRENHRGLPYTPQRPPVTGSGRYIASWNTNILTVWRILKRTQMILDFDENEPKPNYKAVAQIALKGDENINDAALGLSGTLLAVSTAAGTKIFQLKPRTTNKLKVSSIEAPPRLSNSGSGTVKFSPDSKWLLTIGLSNQIAIFRILGGERGNESCQIISRPTTLRRLRREKRTQTSLNGNWGSYDRKITRAAFSWDSRILAVSDLAGFVDTFILEGNEDLTLPADDLVHRNSTSGSADSDQSDHESASDSDSSLSSNDASLSRIRKVITFGQHWTQNPVGKSIPRQPSAPILLSFRPPATVDQHQNSSTYTSQNQINGLPNGNPGVHPTRHRPHAHAHTIPSESSKADHLFVITARHDIHELEVLKGRLSDWSRRNTTTSLPNDFKLQRDRVMGCIWDTCPPSPTAKGHSNSKTNESRERLWLYAATWVCMFDLTQDLELSSQEAQHSSSQGDTDGPKINGILTQTNGKKESRKRKRKRKISHTTTVSENLSRKKHTTGAGSKVPDRELGHGLGSRTIRRVDEEGNESFVDIDDAAEAAREARSSSVDEDEDENDVDEEEPRGSLQHLRSRDEPNGVEDTNDNEEKSLAKQERHPAFYLTNRYRSILGILPLESSSAPDGESAEEAVNDAKESGGASKSGEAVEVALIERPFWDLELPPRFMGAHEYKD